MPAEARVGIIGYSVGNTTPSVLATVPITAVTRTNTTGINVGEILDIIISEKSSDSSRFYSYPNYNSHPTN